MTCFLSSSLMPKMPIMSQATYWVSRFTLRSDQVPKQYLIIRLKPEIRPNLKFEQKGGVRNLTCLGMPSKNTSETIGRGKTTFALRLQIVGVDSGHLLTASGHVPGPGRGVNMPPGES